MPPLQGSGFQKLYLAPIFSTKERARHEIQSILLPMAKARKAGDTMYCLGI